MASSSGNSATSSHIQNSGSEGDLKQVMDERKRKRMQSNRESARRSRMRKQKHLDDLTAQVAHLRSDNHQILNTINLNTQQYLTVEAENSVLRAQMSELSQRLESLNEMVNCMNTLSGFNSLEEGNLGFLGNGMGDFGFFNGYTRSTDSTVINNSSNNTWALGYLNQPIMASANVLYN